MRCSLETPGTGHGGIQELSPAKVSTVIEIFNLGYVGTSELFELLVFICLTF